MVEDNLINLLETFNYPIFRQGSLNDDSEYPETFITFREDSEVEERAYDNENFSVVVYTFFVQVYSINPTTCYETLTQIRKLLKKNNWVTPDRGHDVASDQITHIGRGLICSFVNYEED